MKIRFAGYYKRSRTILPLVLIFLTTGFTSGMRICTALLYHGHPLEAHHYAHADHHPEPDSADDGRMLTQLQSHCNDHVCCTRCSHRHIPISMHHFTRIPQVQAPMLTRISVPCTPIPPAPMTNGLRFLPDRPPLTLAQHIGPVVLLI